MKKFATAYILISVVVISCNYDNPNEQLSEETILLEEIDKAAHGDSVDHNTTKKLAHPLDSIYHWELPNNNAQYWFYDDYSFSHTIEKKLIDSIQYYDFKKNYTYDLHRKTLDILSNQQEYLPDFAIPLSKKYVMFDSEDDKGIVSKHNRLYWYLGYAEGINMHLVHLESSMIGVTLFLDSIHNRSYCFIGGHSDYSFDKLYYNGQNKMFATAINDYQPVADVGSYLEIIQVSPGDTTTMFTPIYAEKVNSYSINDIIWIDHNSLAIQTYKSVDNSSKPIGSFEYYEIELMKK